MTTWHRLTLICLAVLTMAAPAASLAAADPDRNATHSDTQFYDPTDGCGLGDNTLTSVTGKDNIDVAMKFFITQHGLTPIQAAAIVGNFMWESGGGVGLNPSADANKGTATFPTDSDGFGIAQWTFASRQQPLVKLANAQNKAPNNLTVQLNYVWEELTGRAPAADMRTSLAALKKTSNPSSDPKNPGVVNDLNKATLDFMNVYEAPAAATANLAARQKGAFTALGLANAEGLTPANTGDGSSASSCGISSTNSTIADTAVNSKLTWPSPDCTQTADGEVRGSCFDPRKAYQAAWQKFNPINAGDPFHLTDCGIFVATVMHMSGADKKYPGVLTTNQMAYVKAHPEIYQVLTNAQVSRIGQLQPGDILINVEHTEFYVGGTSKNSHFPFASASYTDFTPELQTNDEFPWFQSQGAFVVARLKNQGAATP